MIITAIRTLILYIVVLFTLRIMEKSELSKMSTFQMVVLFMIAELAAIPIDSPEKSLLTGITAILTLLFLQVLISWLSLKLEWFKNFINGRPAIVVENGNLNVKEMKRLRMTINELFEQLRIGGAFSLSEVEYAVIETSGDLSVIQKNQENTLPLVIVSDGKFYSENLSKAHKSYSEFQSEMNGKGIDCPEDIFVAFYDGDSVLHIYPYPSKNESFAKEV